MTGFVILRNEPNNEKLCFDNVVDLGMNKALGGEWLWLEFETGTARFKLSDVVGYSFVE